MVLKKQPILQGFVLSFYEKKEGNHDSLGFFNNENCEGIK